VEVTKFAQTKKVYSSVKTMLNSFFDVDEIVHIVFVSPGQAVNLQFLLECVETTA
jgi:hypothetical protein